MGEHFLLTRPGTWDKSEGHAGPGSRLCRLLDHSGSLFSSDPGNFSSTMDNVIVLEIEVKGSGEPFQVLLEPYALIIPGENYIGVSVKKDFKVGHSLSRPSPGWRRWC